MNRYESVMLDEMLEEYDVFEKSCMGVTSGDKETATMAVNATNTAMANVMRLLKCVKRFREPPKELPVEDGCGVMAKAVEK